MHVRTALKQGQQLEGTLPDGRAARVPRQANNLANVALHYDDGSFSTRLAMSYKDSLIEEHGATAARDSYYGAFSSLDLTVNGKLTPRSSVDPAVRRTE